MKLLFNIILILIFSITIYSVDWDSLSAEEQKMLYRSLLNDYKEVIKKYDNMLSYYRGRMKRFNRLQPILSVAVKGSMKLGQEWNINNSILDIGINVNYYFKKHFYISSDFYYFEKQFCLGAGFWF
jgi:hypothetical protein